VLIISELRLRGDKHNYTRLCSLYAGPMPILNEPYKGHWALWAGFVVWSISKLPLEILD